MKKIVWSVLRVSLALYVAIAAGVYFFQEKLLFHADPLPPDFKFGLTLPFEERMVTGGPDRIDGLLVHPPKAHGLLLYFHGNAGNLEDWAGEAEELAQLTKWNVWIIDYPGFGKSSGSIHSEDQLHADADAVFAAAKKEAGKAPLALMGRSIGTGFAARLAAKNPVAGLVLESAYYSMSRMGKIEYPWLPGFLLRYPLNSFTWLPQVKAPVLMFHGTEDELIPFGEGRDLSLLLPGAQFIPISGGHHNDLGRFPQFWRELEKFFAGLPAR